MILATVITNLVMALMIQKPSITVNNDGTFGISVETQYIHSVTIHEFDSISVNKCKMCKKPIVLTPIDYLGVKPLSVIFSTDELRQKTYHTSCDPWIYINPIYINPEVTNGWFKVKHTPMRDIEFGWKQNHKEDK